MQKWEYLKVTDPGLDEDDSLTERDLNELGDVGWELVSVEPAKVTAGSSGPGGHYVGVAPRIFWLKRPKEELIEGVKSAVGDAFDESR